MPSFSTNSDCAAVPDAPCALAALAGRLGRERVKLASAATAAGPLANGARAVAECAVTCALAAQRSWHANPTGATEAHPRCNVPDHVHGNSVARCCRATHTADAAPVPTAVAGAVLARNGVGGGATLDRAPHRRATRCAHAASAATPAHAAAVAAASQAARLARSAPSEHRARGAATRNRG